MGLGPPVCLKCEIIMSLDEQSAKPWVCKKCGSTERVASLWEFSDEQQKQIRINTNKV
jgi:transcription initiation factor IIE alpha subunit